MLGEYDLVFAKARCALEAMAAGCAVVLCDELGAGSLVRAEDWQRLRAWNFGRRACAAPLTAEALVAQIRLYDPADAAAVCRLTRTESGLPAMVDALVRLYRAVIEEHRTAPTDAAEEARAVAEYLRTQRPYPLLYRVAERDRECECLRHAAEVARAGWQSAYREAETLRHAAEDLRAGWQSVHDAAGDLRVTLGQAEAECERLRLEMAALSALFDQTLSRRVWRGSRQCVSWLRRRLRRAG